MDRVFLYELRRQVVSKFFMGILAVCLFYAWMVLSTSVIQGIANTAPFSPWSFGYYMDQVLPLLIIALLFSLRTVFSPSAKRVGVLTAATPVNERAYTLLKYGAALLSWVIILICTVLLGLIFLIRIFGDSVQAGKLLLPCVAAVLPASIFFFGVGLFVGFLKKWQSIAVIILAAVISAFPVPGYAALFGAGFFSQHPLTLGILDPAFSLPPAMIAGRAIYAAVGVALVIVSLGTGKE